MGAVFEESRHMQKSGQQYCVPWCGPQQLYGSGRRTGNWSMPTMANVVWVEAVMMKTACQKIEKGALFNGTKLQTPAA